jgi:predicted nucleic acid-binding protein
VTLVDTDVLIWHLRGNAKASAVLAGVSPFAMSAVTYMELLQGVRGKEEIRFLRHDLASFQARLVYPGEDVAAKAVMLMERLRPAHDLGLADALIAATALSGEMPLLTANVRHYRDVEGLKLSVFKAS